MATVEQETTAEMVAEADQDPGDETQEPEEPVEPDDDEDEAGAQVEPPVPAAPSLDAQAESFEKAGKRAGTYFKAVGEILGDAMQDLSLCPRCSDFLPGLILPVAIKPVTDEQKLAVKQSIGELLPPELRSADDATACGKCGGYGKVLTGSQVEREKVGKCFECDGRGWMGNRLGKLRNQPEPLPSQQFEQNGPPPEQAPVQDPWGRFADDPLYGVMPGFERA